MLNKKLEYNLVWITRYRGRFWSLVKKASGNKEILFRLGIYRDENKARLCSFVYGHFLKVYTCKSVNLIK